MYSTWANVERQKTKLRSKIKDLLDVIVPFLDRDVNYVITEIKGFTGSNNPSTKNTDSTECTPSASNGITTRRSRTRAETMLEKISKSKVKSIENSVLNEALRWKIPIYSLKYFEKWIDSRPKPVEPEKVESQEFCGLRTFSKSFLKLESLLSSDFRPEFREISSWPKIEATSFVGSCPFRKRRKKKKRPKKECEGNPKKRLKPAFNLAVANGGYCEICNEEFLDLDDHVQTPFHSQFANNQKNYAALDKAIAQNSVCYLFGIGRNLRNPRRRTVQPTLERIMPTPTKSNATAEVLKDVEIGLLSAKLSTKKQQTPTKPAAKRVPKQALPSGKQEATGSPCTSTCAGQDTPRRRGRPPKSATATPNASATPNAAATPDATAHGSVNENLSNELDETASVASPGLTQRARKLAPPGMLVKSAFVKSPSPESSRKRIAPLKLKVSSRSLSKYPSYKIKKERKIKEVIGTKQKKTRRKLKKNLGTGRTLEVTNNLSDQFNCKLDENESLREPLEVVCDTVDNSSQPGSIITTGSVEDNMDHESRSYCGSTGHSQEQSPDDIHQLRPRKHLLLPANLLGTTAEDSVINKSRAVSISPHNATLGGLTPKSDKGKQPTSAETLSKKGLKDSLSSRSSSPALEPFRKRVKSVKKGVAENQLDGKLQATPNLNDGENSGHNLVDTSIDGTILRNKLTEMMAGSSCLLSKPRGDKGKQTPSDNVKFSSSDEKATPNGERLKLQASLKLPNENAKVNANKSSTNKQLARVNKSPDLSAISTPKQRRRKLKFQHFDDDLVSDLSSPDFRSPKRKRRKKGSLKKDAIGDVELEGSMQINRASGGEENDFFFVGPSPAGPSKRGKVGRKQLKKELESGGSKMSNERKYESRSNSPILEPLRRKGKPGRKKMTNLLPKIVEPSPKSSDETEVTTSSDHDAYSVASVQELKLSFKKVKKQKKSRDTNSALTPKVEKFFKGYVTKRSAKFGESSSKKSRPLGRPRKDLTKASRKNNSTTSIGVSGCTEDENYNSANDADVKTFPAIEDQSQPDTLNENQSDESGVSIIEWTDGPNDFSRTRGMTHDEFVMSLPYNLTYLGTANSLLESAIPFTCFNDDKLVIDPGPSFVNSLRAKVKPTKISNAVIAKAAYKTAPNTRKYRKRKTNVAVPRLSPRAHASTRANMSSCLKTECETPAISDEPSGSQSVVEGDIKDRNKAPELRGKNKSCEPKDLVKARMRKNISKKMRITRSVTAKEEGKSKFEEIKVALDAFDSYAYRYFAEKKDKKLKPILDWFLPPENANDDLNLKDCEEDIRNMAYEELNIDTELFRRKHCRILVANRVASDFEAIPDLAKFVATSKKCAAIQCARNNILSEEQLLHEVSLLDRDKMGFTVTGERRKRRPPNRYNQFVMNDKFFVDDDAPPFADLDPDLSSKMRDDAMTLFGPTSFDWKIEETCAKGSRAKIDDKNLTAKKDIILITIEEMEMEEQIENANDGNGNAIGQNEQNENVNVENANDGNANGQNEQNENVNVENANDGDANGQNEQNENVNVENANDGDANGQNEQNENVNVENANDGNANEQNENVNVENAKIEMPPIENAKIEMAPIENAKAEMAQIENTKNCNVEIENSEIDEIVESEDALIESALIENRMGYNVESENSQTDKDLENENVEMKIEEIDSTENTIEKIENVEDRHLEIENRLIDDAKNENAKIENVKIENTEIENAHVEKTKSDDIALLPESTQIVVNSDCVANEIEKQLSEYLAGLVVGNPATNYVDSVVNAVAIPGENEECARVSKETDE